MKFQGIQEMKAILAMAAFGIVLAGCSAGGEPTKAVSGGGTTAASLNVSVNKTSITSTGADTAIITVTALDANNNVVSAAPVVIKPDSGLISTSGTSTNTTGVVTGTLSVGSD